jgi:membrane-bound lytic murein transglycosylase A
MKTGIWIIAGGAFAGLVIWLSQALLPPRPAVLHYRPVSFSHLKGWADDDLITAFSAFQLTCQKISTLPGDRLFGPATLAMKAADWQPACAALTRIATPDTQRVRHFFEANFVPLAVSQGTDASGLFTGYYEPELKASRSCGGIYQFPLYRRPPDMVTADLGQFSKKLGGQQIIGRVQGDKFVPYDDRAAIDAGALAGRGLELACAADPVDGFFLEIQGSGRLLFEDGSRQLIGYDGKNGRQYVAIGRVLIKLGEIRKEDVSLQTIRAWLDAHPQRVKEILEANPSYVFFRDLPGQYPLGAAGVELTPGRSLAVDKNFIAYGAPVWLETDLPSIGAGQNGKPFNRLMVAQDTGGAIRGAVRGDVFWGGGREAEELAGAMKQSGHYYMLVPAAVALRLAAVR